MNRYKDTIVGVASIVISIALFIATFFIEEFSRTRLGADFVPRVTAAVLFLLGLTLIIKEYKANRAAAPAAAAPKEPEKKVGLTGPLPVILNILLFVAYLLLLDKVGYLIMTPVYLFLQILLLTDPAKYRPGWYAILSIVVGCSTYYGFALLFQVYLPAGLLS